MKFCPQPSWVTRDHARWIPFLFPVLPNSFRDAVFVFYALAFVPRIFAYAPIGKGVLEKHQALCFLLLSISLSSNFAWASLAFVLLFLFAGSETGNEGSRSGANGWRLLSIQVPEVTSQVGWVSHHVRDFSSVRSDFSLSSKTNNSIRNIVDEELLRGCLISW